MKCTIPLCDITTCCHGYFPTEHGRAVIFQEENNIEAQNLITKQRSLYTLQMALLFSTLLSFTFPLLTPPLLLPALLSFTSPHPSSSSPCSALLYLSSPHPSSSLLCSPLLLPCTPVSCHVMDIIRKPFYLL